MESHFNMRDSENLVQVIRNYLENFNARKIVIWGAMFGLEINAKY